MGFPRPTIPIQYWPNVLWLAGLFQPTAQRLVSMFFCECSISDSIEPDIIPGVSRSSDTYQSAAMGVGVHRYRSSDHHNRAVLTHRHRNADPIINPSEYLLNLCVLAELSRIENTYIFYF